MAFEEVILFRKKLDLNLDLFHLVLFRWGSFWLPPWSGGSPLCFQQWGRSLGPPWHRFHRQRSAHITFKGLVKKHINSEYFLIINIPYPSCRVLCWPPPWRALTLTSASPLKLNHPTLRAEQTTWLLCLPA